MCALTHPHIVRILGGPSKQDGFHYFVMNYLEGGDLHRAICKRQEKLSDNDKLRILLEIGSALQFAHSRGLIHRDVKPENILLDHNNRAYLNDFDLVHAEDTTGGTRSQGAMGTFLYAAPEQLNDASRVTAAADVFGFGMLTAFVIYEAPLPTWVPTNRTLFLDSLDAPPPIKAALDRCLHSDPSQRPALKTLCHELDLHWFPEQRWSAATAPTFRTKSTKPPTLPAGSSGTLQPVVVTKPDSHTGKWLWGMLAIAIGILGLGGTLLQNWTQARRDRQIENQQALSAIDQELKGKRWTKALALANQFLSKPALSEQIRELAMSQKTQAESGWQREQQEQREHYKLMVKRGEYDEAVSLYRTLSKDHANKELLREFYDSAFTNFAARHLAQAELARATKQCGEFLLQIQTILAVDPYFHAAVAAKSSGCDVPPPPVPVPVPNEEPTPNKRQPQKSNTPQKSFVSAKRNGLMPSIKAQALPVISGVESSGAQASKDLTLIQTGKILNEASEAYAHNQYYKAIEKAQAALVGDPYRAWGIIGASACALDDMKKVKEALALCSEPCKEQIATECKKHGTHVKTIEPSTTASP